MVWSDETEANNEEATMSIQCTVPQCSVQGAPESMWLPEWRAVRRANGGRPVPTVDFPKFALCGKHGRMMREGSGVRVYRFSECVASVTAQEEREAAERTHFRTFAQKFVIPTGDEMKRKAGVRFAERGDRRGVVQPGQGLSRFKGQSGRTNGVVVEDAPASL